MTILLTCLMLWAPVVRAHAAETRRVHPDVAIAIIMQESYCRTEAVSDSGARGLMQIMPFWTREPLLVEHCRGRDLHEEEVNICYGVHILAHYLQKCREDYRCALDRYSGRSPGYFSQVRRRMAQWRDLQARAQPGFSQGTVTGGQ